MNTGCLKLASLWDWANKDRPSLRKLMEGLYYPVALGAAFLAIAIKFQAKHTELLAAPAFWLALLFLFYFSISFLHTSSAKANYGAILFVFDLVEAATVVFMLKALGFLEPSSTDEASLKTFYPLLLGVVMLQLLWQKIARLRTTAVVWQGVAAVILAAIGWYLSWKKPTPPARLDTTNLILAAALAFLVISYAMAHGGDGAQSSKAD